MPLNSKLQEGAQKQRPLTILDSLSSKTSTTYSTTFAVSPSASSPVEKPRNASPLTVARLSNKTEKITTQTIQTSWEYDATGSLQYRPNEIVSRGREATVKLEEEIFPGFKPRGMRTSNPPANRLDRGVLRAPFLRLLLDPPRGVVGGGRARSAREDHRGKVYKTRGVCCLLFGVLMAPGGGRETPEFISSSLTWGHFPLYL